MGLYRQLADIQERGVPAALVTVIRTRGSVPRHAGSKMIVFADGTTQGTIGGGEMESRVIQTALEAIQSRATELVNYEFRDPSEGDVGVCGGEMEVFVEPVQIPPKLIVLGAGHVGQALAHLGRWLGYHVVVCDDRVEFASESTNPEADELVHCEPDALTKHVEIHANTFLVLTTRSVEIDVQALPQLLESPAAYIGVIGSRRRWETTAKALQQAGVPQEDLRKVSSPMGLDINAETPEEIALSIFAEIIQHQRGGTGQPMGHDPKLD
ncbi:MAG: XdhC/CoxI family protein [Anaerolineales bacterium]|nr:XdhC/CoxI family protein [Anaerolineales bacterium]